MRIAQSGVLDVEGAVNASTSVDYAEYFESKDGNVIVRSKKRFKSRYDRNFTYFEID